MVNKEQKLYRCL